MTKGALLAAAGAVVCVLVIVNYPPAAVVIVVGWVAGYFAGRTRAEFGRTVHEVKRAKNNATTYRED